MSVFPQLQSGAIAQFPFRATHRRRTIVNELTDGHSIRYEDWGAQRIEWRIEYSDLTAAEWNAIRTLHEEMEGRLGTFTFLDPSANLLAWSEEFERSAWIKGPYITVAGGVADPEGGEQARVLTNGGATEQSIVQRLAIPEAYETCLSVWLRSGGSQTVNLLRQSQRKEVRVGPQWRRVHFGGRGLGLSEETDFGVSIGPGAGIEVFGVQVEAQPAPSRYKRSESAAGIYRKTRFSSDKLESWSEGPGRYRAVVELQSAAEAA